MFVHDIIRDSWQERKIPRKAILTIPWYKNEKCFEIVSVENINNKQYCRPFVFVHGIINDSWQERKIPRKEMLPTTWLQTNKNVSDTTRRHNNLLLIGVWGYLVLCLLLLLLGGGTGAETSPVSTLRDTSNVFLTQGSFQAQKRKRITPQQQKTNVTHHQTLLFLCIRLTFV